MSSSIAAHAPLAGIPSFRRFVVVGCSGAGKSTLARRLAHELGSVHVELDSIYHQANWRPSSPELFLSEVERRIAGDDWVVDGNYSLVQPSVWARAEAVLWLDLPKALVMRQIVRRTLGRAFFRTELWNGNRERRSNLLRWAPKLSMIRWAWTQYDKYVARYEQAMADPRHGRLSFHRLRSHADVERFIAATRAPGHSSSVSVEPKKRGSPSDAE